MHACLNVDEIVRLIACELGKGTAVALACCRKSFEDPVLDALWVKQNRLLPLLKSFPGDVWNDEKCTVSTPTTYFSSLLNGLTRKTFKRLPTATEWGRFRKYTRRMRWLDEYHTQRFPSLETLSSLQLCIINEPLLPNLKSLCLWGVHGWFIPFIPLFLSPRTTSIDLRFLPKPPKATVASMLTTFPKLCPNLRSISLISLPRDSIITSAVSGMVLATNRNILQEFLVDSSLTEEAGGVVYKLPNLCNLSVVIERGTSLPPVSLPDLTGLEITCDNEGDWPQLFHGATLGKLKSVMFLPRSKQIGNFLETFEKAALSSSVQNTLSEFRLLSPSSWNPNYSSLLPFTQLVDLIIGFPCNNGCSSRVDDDVVISLSWTMPRLQVLQLGDEPCREFIIGVTAKGLMALALHCPNLQLLRIHFQVASLIAPPASPGITPDAEPVGLCTDCALKVLEVGIIPAPEESALMVTLALLRIFPRIETIDSYDEGWGKVEDAIRLSKRVIDCSSKQLSHHTLK